MPISGPKLGAQFLVPNLALHSALLSGSESGALASGQTAGRFSPNPARTWPKSETSNMLQLSRISSISIQAVATCVF